MKIIPIYFILAMFLTMLILYLILPEPEILIKYPSLDEEVSDVYVDDNDVCYKYIRKEVNKK
jgi:hypothetical protein